MAFDLFYAACCFDELSRGSVSCLMNANFGKWFPQRHNSMFYAEIDDHGVRRGNTGQILAWWQHPVASRVALELPYWAISSALYRLIRMAIKMAHKAGACISFIDFMSCITVAKWPCYGPLKIKPSYNIVLYYVLILCVYYGGPPTAMKAVLAIISDGKWAIIVINREVVQIN